MKVLMWPIDMIAWFTRDGKPTPVRFRIPAKGDSEAITVIVKHVQFQEEEKIAGNRMILFRCDSTVSGTEKVYELKYELNSCKWFLAKM